MLKLEPRWVEKEFQWTSCVDDALATVSNYYGIEYRFSYAKAWDFKYTPYDVEKDMLFEKRLNTQNALERYHFLTECHRTKMVYHYSDNVDELLGIVENELSHERPCAIRMDSYNIPWDHGYKSLHTNHVCMPVAIGEKEIQVIDPYNHMTDLSFPVSGLKEASGFCITYEVNPQYNEMFDCRSILIQVMEKLLGITGKTNDFDNMRLFSRDLKEHFSIERELSGNNGRFYWSDFYFRLMEFAFGRSFARQTLLYTADRYQSEEIRGLADDFRRMVSKYNYIVAILRGAFRGDGTDDADVSKKVIKEVSDILEMEADLEEQTAYQLLKVLKEIPDDKTSEVKKGIFFGPLVSEPVPADCEKYVDLTSFYDNQAFGRLDNAEKADLTGNGEFFLEDDFPPNKVVSFNGIKFKIDKARKSHYDNIICRGQTIPLHVDHIQRMDFLFAAEPGNYMEQIQLIDSTGQSVAAYIKVQNAGLHSSFGETVTYYGRTVVRKGGNIEIGERPAKVFAVSLQGAKGDIKELILPQCQKLHVFSIKLVLQEEEHDN